MIKVKSTNGRYGFEFSNWLGEADQEYHGKWLAFYDQSAKVIRRGKFDVVRTSKEDGAVTILVKQCGDIKAYRGCEVVWKQGMQSHNVAAVVNMREGDVLKILGYRCRSMIAMFTICDGAIARVDSTWLADEGL